MTPFLRLESRFVTLPVDNVDTDQIIPARFLTTVSREGLGESLFHDWRFDADGQPRPDFPLNHPGARGAAILVAGDNFGCGSSREHAPWALRDFGFRAVVATRFADIFRGNALKNGLLPVTVPAAVQARLVELGRADPGATLVVDLEARALVLPGGEAVSFPIDDFARRCLLDGVDELGYILGHEGSIAAYEAAHPAAFDTRAEGGAR